MWRNDQLRCLGVVMGVGAGGGAEWLTNQLLRACGSGYQKRGLPLQASIKANKMQCQLIDDEVCVTSKEETERIYTLS